MRNSAGRERRAVYVKQQGVTLIELMTVMVVLAILASIAVPSYRSYLIRSQRSDGMSALLQIQSAEEKYYLQNNRYTTDIAGATTATPPGLGLTATSPQGLYDLTVTLGTGASPGDQSYTATATPVPGKSQQDDNKCLTLSLDDSGKRSATGPAGPAACWK